jgi:hypothetical protein
VIVRFSNGTTTGSAAIVSSSKELVRRRGQRAELVPRRRLSSSCSASLGRSRLDDGRPRVNELLPEQA